MRADGQMDMKLIVAFRNFADAPKNFYLFCFKFCLRIVGVEKGNFCSFLLGDVGLRLPLAATLPSKSCGAATDLSLFANNSCRKVTIYGLTPAHSSLLKHCTVVWRTVNERILAACAHLHCIDCMTLHWRNAKFSLLPGRDGSVPCS